IRRWDPKTGRERNPQPGPHGQVHWVAFGPDDRSVFLAARDRLLRRWDLTTDTESTVISWEPASPSIFDGEAMTPEGPVVATCDPKSHKVLVWGPGKSTEPRRLGGHADMVWGFAFSSDGRLLVTGGKDRTIRLWDLRTGTEVRKLEGLADQVNVLAFG